MSSFYKATHQVNLKKSIMLFFVILIHNSILDFLYVTHKGPVFLWKQAAEPSTIIVHLLTALLVTCFFLLMNQVHKEYVKRNTEIRDRLLIICSIVMAGSIGYLLFLG